MKLNREYQFFLFVMTVLILGGAAFLWFNQKGYAKFRQVRKNVDSLNMVIQTLEQENRLLQNSIDSLQNKVPAKINRLARERYNMKKPGESVISVDER